MKGAIKIVGHINEKHRRLSGHSQTLTRSLARHSVREVMERGRPMPLSPEIAQRLQSHPLIKTIVFTVILMLTAFVGCVSGPSRSAGHSTQPQSSSAPAPTRRAPTEILREAASKPSEPLEGEGWVSFFDGKTLTGWRETDFAGHGMVEIESGLILLNTGDPMTGINWTNRIPKMDYEVALDAMRVTGSDFFCGLTVPVGESFCTLIVGGWGGSLVGISSLDGQDASENETTKFLSVEQGRWYRIRMRVTQSRIEAWIDKEKFVNVDTTDKRISLRPGDIESSKPFGIASYQTTAALREIKLRRVLGPADPLKKQ
jgi:hypothetical protein